MPEYSADINPLTSPSSRSWDELVEAVGPASLLVVIESRMAPALRRQYAAEDVFQEALLHAWRDRAKCEWRGLKSFRSWLLTIIDHRIGHLAAAADTKKRGADVRVTSYSAYGGAPGESTDGGSNFPGPVVSTTPSRIAIFREQAESMRQALAELSPEIASVVHLRLFEQLTLDEIAERLSIGLSVVRRRFGQGLEQYENALRHALVSRSRIQ